MTIYYSPSLRGFFADEIHGARTLMVPDPSWVAPEVEEGQEAPEHPLIEVPNPDCRLPGDAVEITQEEHAAAMTAQASGQQIGPGPDGKPIVIARPAPTAEELAASARAMRDSLLSATDWTQARDVPSATAAKWAPYRQELRDWPQGAGFPDLSTLPKSPT